MKKTILIILLGIFLVSCKDPNIDTDGKSIEELLTLKAWQLDKYTDPDGKLIADGSLNATAKMLYGLVFHFETGNSVKGIDKNSKTVFRKGVWNLDENNSLKIDIPGLQHDFIIHDITKTKMILSTQNEEEFKLGAGPEIRMVFSHFDL